MDAISYSNVRAKLADMMKRVCRDKVPIIITRRNAKSVVMMSLEDYESLEETAHLLRSPANARRLLKSIQSLDSGKGRVRKLVE